MYNPLYCADHLWKVYDTDMAVSKIQNQMELKAPQLVKTQQDIEDILRELDTSTAEMEARVQFVEEEQVALTATKSTQEQIRAECEKQFEEVVPKL